jgi:hypothetical protein
LTHAKAIVERSRESVCFKNADGSSRAISTLTIDGNTASFATSNILWRGCCTGNTKLIQIGQQSGIFNVPSVPFADGSHIDQSLELSILKPLIQLLGRDPDFSSTCVQ